MKTALVIFLLIGAIAAAERKGKSRQNIDVSDDRSDSSRSGSGSVRERFPNFFRVEAEIIRLDNQGGILSNGKSCDFTGACDPVVQAYLDADSPLSPFPGTSRPLKEWNTIFQADNQNSPTIGKSVNRDVCGGSLNKVNLRTYITDSDTASMADEIGKFECVFDLDPRDITADALSAKWGPTTECKGLAQQGKIRLFARQRAYEISAASCSATNSGGGSSDSRLGTDLSASPGAHVPGQHDFIRIDTEIIQLLNPQGLLASKKSCDTTSKCDPRIDVHLDTDKPLAAWPGSKTIPQYTKLFETSNVDSPIVNMNVSKNICGGSVGTVNLRAHVTDVNSFTSNGLIEDFECLFNADYRRIASDLSSSEWSPSQDCKPQHPGNDIRLQYRYRLYDIPQSQCGIKG